MPESVPKAGFPASYQHYRERVSLSSRYVNTPDASAAASGYPPRSTARSQLSHLDCQRTSSRCCSRRSWRCALFALPHLWARHIGALPKSLDEMLERSGPTLPITLRIYSASFRGDPTLVWRRLRDDYPHLRVRISAIHYTETRVNELFDNGSYIFLQQGSLPRLEAINIVANETHWDEEDSRYEVPRFETPSLQRLVLTNVTCSTSSTALTVLNLTVKECPVAPSPWLIDATHLREMFRICCTSLLDLHLNIIFLHFDDTYAGHERIHFLALERMRYFDPVFFSSDQQPVVLLSGYYGRARFPSTHQYPCVRAWLTRWSIHSKNFMQRSAPLELGYVHMVAVDKGLRNWRGFVGGMPVWWPKEELSKSTPVVSLHCYGQNQKIHLDAQDVVAQQEQARMFNSLVKWDKVKYTVFTLASGIRAYKLTRWDRVPNTILHQRHREDFYTSKTRNQADKVGLSEHPLQTDSEVPIRLYDSNSVKPRILLDLQKAIAVFHMPDESAYKDLNWDYPPPTRTVRLSLYSIGSLGGYGSVQFTGVSAVVAKFVTQLNRSTILEVMGDALHEGIPEVEDDDIVIPAGTIPPIEGLNMQLYHTVAH
ncbi:hypothetical protein PENSPDRAFT_672362, partial [Peniophora sp. CONT]